MNKLLLALIAAGLWANAALTFVRHVHADSEYGPEILSELQSIKSTISDIKSDTDDISRSHTRDDLDRYRGAV